MVKNTYFGAKKELRSKLIYCSKRFSFKRNPQEIVLGYHHFSEQIFT